MVGGFMSITLVENPFSVTVPEEVHLKHAPLIRVLAQIRFPVQTAFDRRETTEPVLAALRDFLPVVRAEPIQGVFFQPLPTNDLPRLVEQQGWTIWRLSDLNNDWRVSLARDFLSLETTAYQSHGQFIENLRRVFDALPLNLRPPVVDRFGLRYVDRLTAPALLRISDLVRGELLGVLGTVDAERVVQAFSESVFDLTPDQLIARWGRLSPNTTYDPGTITPIPEASWVLDLDMVREKTRPFDIGILIRDAQTYAERIYTFFRWAIKSEFLTYFNEHTK